MKIHGHEKRRSRQRLLRCLYTENPAAMAGFSVYYKKAPQRILLRSRKEYMLFGVDLPDERIEPASREDLGKEHGALVGNADGIKRLAAVFQGNGGDK